MKQNLHLVIAVPSLVLIGMSVHSTHHVGLKIVDCPSAESGADEGRSNSWR